MISISGNMNWKAIFGFKVRTFCMGDSSNGRQQNISNNWLRHTFLGMRDPTGPNLGKLSIVETRQIWGEIYSTMKNGGVF